jgi:hypothetical protein
MLRSRPWNTRVILLTHHSRIEGILFETPQGKITEDAERVDHRLNGEYGAREQSRKRRDGQPRFGGVTGY